MLGIQIFKTFIFWCNFDFVTIVLKMQGCLVKKNHSNSEDGKSELGKKVRPLLVETPKNRREKEGKRMRAASLKKCGKIIEMVSICFVTI